LKKRIDDSLEEGVLTSHIREDYEPAGNLMMHSLFKTVEYVQRKVPQGSPNSQWRIFNQKYKPY